MLQLLRVRSPDVENVEENTAQKNATIRQCNAYTARIHMKHGVKKALYGLLRSTDLRNYEIFLPTPSPDKDSDRTYGAVHKFLSQLSLGD
jgi:hypothetical protein